MAFLKSNHARHRVAITEVYPELECGRFPIKRCIGDIVSIEADLLSDGHDPIVGVLLYRHETEERWESLPLQCKENDRWYALLKLEKIGNYSYTIKAWVNESFCSVYPKELKISVDRKKADFSAWYELFPRSWSKTPGTEGTFKDVTQKLSYIKELGFDVLYLPPIHPIGCTHRKGKNNTLKADSNDPGSPWSIGNIEGGHLSVHPSLGTLEDFKDLVKKAGDMDIEIALDIALQCSPDHPYLKDHPEWFKKKSDGTLQYAENPPKKYEDIYPLNFESEAWESLWEECKTIFLFWIKQGVKIFRVDNPHTKPFVFWEWLIAEIKREYPETLFLAEAFTRPKIMYRLAKLGFSQSYTYFIWRNTKQELIDYFQEINKPPISDFFRPNLWPNTPDVLHESLQMGGKPAFIVRFVLAATLSGNYGLYGPAFELLFNLPLNKGSEEYLDSEKYEIKKWDLNDSHSIKNWITKINALRNQYAVFKNPSQLSFHFTDNPNILCYSRYLDVEIILVIVNLDYHAVQRSDLELDVEALGISFQSYNVYDLLNETTLIWKTNKNVVELTTETPAYIYLIKGTHE